MKCPKCSRTLSPEEIKSLWASYCAAQRTTHAPGREPIPTRCPKCGAKCPSVRAAGEHCRKPRKR
jgi:hypothetical protein